MLVVKVESEYSKRLPVKQFLAVKRLSNQKNYRAGH
jgi:hypothetical protein